MKRTLLTSKNLLLLFALVFQQLVNAQSECWSKLASGYSHTIALAADGTLWGWGYNANGQVGVGNTTDQQSPVQIGTGSDWVEIGAGYWCSYAIKSDGTLWSWGWNLSGQLGLGNSTDVWVPNKVGIDTDWAKVEGGDRHTIALKTDGSIWTWGSDFAEQLGNGIMNTDSNVPQELTGLPLFSKIAAGGNHCLALTTDNKLYAWGYDSWGQIGDGNGTGGELEVPTVILPNETWQAIAGMNFSSLAIRQDGTLWYWGKEFHTSNLTDIPVQMGSANNWLSMDGIVGHAMFVKNNGTLWGIGLNNYGQLGTGNTTDLASLTQIGTATNFSQHISCNGESSLLLNTNGQLMSTGRDNGQNLGNGPGNNTQIFTLVDCPAGITASAEELIGSAVISAFPNPVIDVITIRSVTSTAVMISDVNGTILSTIEMNGESDVNVINFAPGIYFIRTAEGQTMKFIKE